MPLFRDKNILFISLFLLSVILPSNNLNASKYMGLGIGLIIALLFLKILSNKKTFKSIINNYKIEIFLFGLLLFDLLVSAFINFESYPSPLSFIFFGGATLFVMALFPVSYLLYRQLPGLYRMELDISCRNTLWMGFALLMLIHILGILFVFLGAKMEPIYEYTIARTALEGRTKSILNHHTTYGVISGLSLIFCISFVVNRKERDQIRFLAILTMVVALIGGIFSSSRNFFWTTGIGCFVISLQHIRSKRAVLHAFSAILGIIITFHVVTIYVPAVGSRFDPYLPYLHQLRYGKPLPPQKSDSTLEGTGFKRRIELWGQAIKLWHAKPVIGVGPGVFRLKNTKSTDVNVHNVFLQALTEGGIIGFLLSIALIGRIIYRSCKHPVLPVFIALWAALLFDNFLDYSIPFVICTSYMLATLVDSDDLKAQAP